MTTSIILIIVLSLSIIMKNRLLLLGFVGGSNLRVCAKPLAANASWYGGAAALNTASLLEMLHNLIFTAAGMFLTIEGG